MSPIFNNFCYPQLSSRFSLLDPTSGSQIASYRIHKITFCARGPADSDMNTCFAFTCGHGDKPDEAIFQCHVFRCDAQEAVSRHSCTCRYKLKVTTYMYVLHATSDDLPLLTETNS